MSTSPALEVDDLHVTFGSGDRSVHAVRGVSLELARGEILGIVGESGCGKSTTTLAIPRLLTGSVTVRARRVTVAGVDVTKPDDKTLSAVRGRRIGMVFQDPTSSLNPSMTIGKQIAETLRLHLGLDRVQAMERAVELLREVGIPDASLRVKEFPHRLSGGQRQRVMIAIAVACRPAVVIADEATTALDVTVQAEILDLLRRLRDDAGTALIIVTHDLGVVGDFADRVAVMYAGRVVESGPVRDVISRPSHPYTEALLACAPRLGASSHGIRPIDGSPPDLSRPIVGCAFADRCQRRTERCSQEDPALTPDAVHQVACWNPVGRDGDGAARRLQ